MHSRPVFLSIIMFSICIPETEGVGIIFFFSDLDFNQWCANSFYLNYTLIANCEQHHQTLKQVHLFQPLKNVLNCIANSFHMLFVLFFHIYCPPGLHLVARMGEELQTSLPFHFYQWKWLQSLMFVPFYGSIWSRINTLSQKMEKSPLWLLQLAKMAW